jgi:hypothetical protein
MRKFGLTVLILTVLGTASAFAGDGGGIYFDTGFGFGGGGYGKELSEALDNIRAQVNPREFVFYYDIALGYAVLPQTLFVTGTAGGYSHRLTDTNQDYIQINNYLFGAGVRYYPFKRGLQLGLDLGLAKENEHWSVSGQGIPDYNSGPGLGAKASVSYDFDTVIGGPSLLVGANFMYSYIRYSEDTNVGITKFALFTKFVYK